jgi:hypothetical protein
MIHRAVLVVLVLASPASGVVLDYAGAGDASYVVAMDKDGPGRTSTVFSADDIEPDV